MRIGYRVPPSKEKKEERRNNNRGMRSLKAIAERKIQRSARRRAARRLYRSLSANPKDRKTNRSKAKAQEPKEKLKYGKRIRIATLNAHGMKIIGKREEIETWMKEREYTY